MLSICYSLQSLCFLLQYLYRYDINAKELKHMKPFPENFLESLVHPTLVASSVVNWGS